jgi:UDP-N-acetylmuramoyl-tripeptide--D-alanyl-D-alanine ligase
MRWTVQQVAGALGVPPPVGLDPLARLAGVSIDSRTLRPGELFFAIRGPSHDGHTFVATVLAADALAGVVARDQAASYPAEIRDRLFVVEDTLAALQQLARSVCRAWREERPGRRVAAITGSTGKTTTKEILAALLAARFRVLKSEGNLNNDYGLPLTLFRLENEDVAVVELGMSRRGELARLAAVCEPEVGIVTNVAPVHLEFFASVDEIALAKRELIEGLGGEHPVAVLNADDARVSRFAEGFRGRVLKFGTAPGAQFRAEEIEDRGAEGCAFEFIAPAGRTRLDLPLAGRHNVQNALAALAAASEWGVGAGAAQIVFPALRPAAMRGEVLKFEEGFSVINDAYNSNPLALARMVDLLAATPGYRRRILAAGEMLELGPTSPALHREAGRHAAAKKIDWIIGVRGDAAELVAGATAAGQPEGQAQFFATSEEAATFLAGMVDRGDLLLVKGSRGVRMERIIEALRRKFRVKNSPSTKEPVEAARQVRG